MWFQDVWLPMTVPMTVIRRFLWGELTLYKGRDGFTLIELLLVLAVVSILLAIGVPALQDGSDRVKLDAACDELATAARYVQSLAIRDGISYGIAFDKAGNRFYGYEVLSGNVILDPIRKAPYVIDLDNDDRMRGVTLVSAGFGGNSFVEFDGKGEVATGGTAVFGVSGLTRSITVTGPTGKIDIQ